MRRKLLALAGILIAGAVVAGVALAAASPSVFTEGVSAIGQTSVALHGKVNPNGSSTTYYFQWGLTNGYGKNGPVRSAGSGTTAVAVHETAKQLTPGTRYHYRLVATNHTGTSVGADRTFTTAGHPPPAVMTGAATGLSSSGAVLNGTVNPSGQGTTWYFQWGSLNSLSQQTAPQRLGPTSAFQSVSWSLQGLLNAATVYQYRLVAFHPKLPKVYGPTAIFMTYPSVRPYAQVRARTRPRHALRRPYVLTTSGTIRGPYWIPAQFACIGEVTVRVYVGTRHVRFKTARVQSNCTFSAQTLYRRLPARTHAPVHLRVVVHFVSTRYLANGHPAVGHTTLG